MIMGPASGPADTTSGGAGHMALHAVMRIHIAGGVEPVANATQAPEPKATHPTTGGGHANQRNSEARTPVQEKERARK